MQLQHRLLKKITRPLMEVEKTLAEQGFHRVGTDNPEYVLNLNDPVTRSYYSLRIPFFVTFTEYPVQVRLETPYLIKRYSYHPLDSYHQIPNFIRRAAEEKALEVYTYLQSLSSAQPYSCTDDFKNIVENDDISNSE